jgi:hypothetical protein
MSVHGPRPRLKQLLFRAWSRKVVTLSAAARDGIAWRGGVTPASRIALLPGYTIDPARFHPAIPPATSPPTSPPPTSPSPSSRSTTANSRLPQRS